MIRGPGLATLCLLAGACADGPADVRQVRITIPAGSSVSIVADSLAAHAVISSPRAFRWYTRITGRDRSLQAGVFEFRSGMSLSAALAVLVNGRAALDRFVVQEGLMLSEIREAAADQLGIDRDAFMEAASDPSLLRRVGARGPTVEGYLYPSTYHVRIGASAREVVEQMVAEFERQWRPEWDARIVELGTSRDEVVTLASIIEGEVRVPADRRYVSSVYHNRLDRGMRLQADPTVIYALGRRRRLFERDYSTRSPYNTYQIDGLPPHPIGEPTAASLEAALYPQHTDFLYFVADSAGRHVFARTYRDHLANIRRIRSP